MWIEGRPYCRQCYEERHGALTPTHKPNSPYCSEHFSQARVRNTQNWRQRKRGDASRVPDAKAAVDHHLDPVVPSGIDNAVIAPLLTALAQWEVIYRITPESDIQMRALASRVTQFVREIDESVMQPVRSALEAAGLTIPDADID